MKRYISSVVSALFLALPVAHAQQATREYSFPSASGSLSPPSTLRITASEAAPAAVPVRDTPESVEMYKRCRTVSDRAATSNAVREAGLTLCLKELEERRSAR
jgi:hypothetical protein